MHQRSLNIIFLIFQSSFYQWYISTIIYLLGDIETNVGPITNYSHGFKICLWNLNSIPIDDFIKIPLLEAFALTHNYDVICLCETFLNSFYDDCRLKLSGYSLL